MPTQLTQSLTHTLTEFLDHIARTFGHPAAEAIEVREFLLESILRTACTYLLLECSNSTQAKLLKMSKDTVVTQEVSKRMLNIISKEVSEKQLLKAFDDAARDVMTYYINQLSPSLTNRDKEKLGLVVANTLTKIGVIHG